MRAIVNYILLLMLFMKIVCCEVTDQPKCCEDLQENGELNFGYYVAYNNATQPFIIYCGEEYGMTSASDLVTSGARNCYELQQQGMDVDGPSIIYPYANHPETPLLVFCDQTTDQGGWTAIQRRKDGIEDFFRSWEFYEVGFGSVEVDFWLGNIAIHELTNQTVNELRVDVEDWEGEHRYAHYKLFYIDDNKYNGRYQLDVAMYSGTAGDSLRYHNGEYFSTFDSDNDEASGNCAEERHGAWWYDACADSNLNGQYYNHGDVGSEDGIQWEGLHDGYYSLKTASMQIRPVQGP